MRVRLFRGLLGRMGKFFAVGIVLVAACSPKPTAADVCKKIEASGLASGCKEEKPGALTGPHRYGSRKALVFVQANDGLSLEDGKKLKAIVDGL